MPTATASRRTDTPHGFTLDDVHLDAEEMADAWSFNELVLLYQTAKSKCDSFLVERLRIALSLHRERNDSKPTIDDPRDPRFVREALERFLDISLQMKFLRQLIPELQGVSNLNQAAEEESTFNKVVEMVKAGVKRPEISRRLEPRFSISGFG